MAETNSLLPLLLFAAGVALGIYSSGGSTLLFSVSSPDKAERLDFYSATRWQSLGHGNADMLGFVRLVRVAGNEELGTTEAFELSGSGPAFWDRGVVQVGTSAVFNRASGRWSTQ